MDDKSMNRCLQLFIAISLTIGCFYWFRGGAVPWMSDIQSVNGNTMNGYVFLHGFENKTTLPHCWDSRVIPLQMSHQLTRFALLTGMTTLTERVNG
jgi:hypothetical protein